MAALLLTLVVALPLGIYFSLVQQAEQRSQREAQALSSVVSVFRAYHATKVTERILSGDGRVNLSENYHQIPGGVPIPATLSIELGDAIAKASGETGFSVAFVSDAPFLNRQRLATEPFQLETLRAFRADEKLAKFSRFDTTAQGELLHCGATQRLHALCEDMDSGAEELIEEHRALLSAAYPAHFEALAQAVKGFNFDAALSQLDAVQVARRSSPFLPKPADVLTR